MELSNLQELLVLRGKRAQLDKRRPAVTDEQMYRTDGLSEEELYRAKIEADAYLHFVVSWLDKLSTDHKFNRPNGPQRTCSLERKFLIRWIWEIVGAHLYNQAVPGNMRAKNYRSRDILRTGSVRTQMQTEQSFLHGSANPVSRYSFAVSELIRMLAYEGTGGSRKTKFCSESYAAALVANLLIGLRIESVDPRATVARNILDRFRESCGGQIPGMSAGALIGVIRDANGRPQLNYVLKQELKTRSKQVT